MGRSPRLRKRDPQAVRLAEKHLARLRLEMGL
jgi:hypothetical protein